jgi:hypothetical protein
MCELGWFGGGGEDYKKKKNKVVWNRKLIKFGCIFINNSPLHCL